MIVEKDKVGVRVEDLEIVYQEKCKGITLIALVITIIILLILARSKFKYSYRRKWNFNKNKDSITSPKINSI